MIEQEYEPLEGVDLAKGLPMLAGTDPAALAKEKALLQAVQNKPFWMRWRAYLGMTGPGWLQSALTLGAGSSAASLFAGAIFGYQLLWVQPLAMLLGVIMLSTMVHQTLTTGQRPFDAMKRYLHPSLAWAWAIAALASTVIWHIPQYALAAGMSQDMIKAVTQWEPTARQETVSLLILGSAFLCVSIFVTWSYGSGHKGVRIYEKVLKGFVWLIIAAFAMVVIHRTWAGAIRWGELARGLIPGIPKITYAGQEKYTASVIMGAFAGAVGINMTFLFPYTLLARGWGKEHRGLGKFDLFTGMLIPYSIATGLIIIATGSTLYGTEAMEKVLADGRLGATQAASMFYKAGVPLLISRIVFGLGIVGMVLSSITMQMLVAGFAVCEMFKVEPGGKLYKWACLIPAPAFLGVLFWQKMSFWIAIPTSAICGVMLPIAYIGFFLLNNSKRYLQSDKPSGPKAFAWNLAMLVAIFVSTACAVYYVYTSVIPYMQKLIAATG
ncbi:MAG: divalent metal cation transporter [Sedimentisphaerales bacterium]|nr:divalent metal cation transporter [Sedimentisphaerales bacterium]